MCVQCVCVLFVGAGVFTGTCVLVCACMCMYTSAFVCVCMCVGARACAHMHTHRHTRACECFCVVCGLQALVERLSTAAADSSGTRVQVAAEDAAAVAARVREVLEAAREVVLQAERQEVGMRLRLRVTRACLRACVRWHLYRAGDLCALKGYTPGLMASALAWPLWQVRLCVGSDKLRALCKKPSTVFLCSFGCAELSALLHRLPQSRHRALPAYHSAVHSATRLRACLAHACIRVRVRVQAALSTEADATADILRAQLVEAQAKLEAVTKVRSASAVCGAAVACQLRMCMCAGVRVSCWKVRGGRGLRTAGALPALFLPGAEDMRRWRTYVHITRGHARVAMCACVHVQEQDSRVATLSAALRTATGRVEELMEQAAGAQAEVLAAEKQAAQGEAALRRQLEQVRRSPPCLCAHAFLLARSWGCRLTRALGRDSLAYAGVGCMQTMNGPVHYNQTVCCLYE